MTESEIRQLLDEHGLERVAHALLALAAPTIRISISPVDEATLPVGASKLGGLPDLPPGVAWPAWHEPMAFIGQINMAAVAPHDREGALPPTGLLSFFYETDGEPLYAAGWGLPPRTPPEMFPTIDARLSWKALYLPGDPADFARREQPAGLNPNGRFRACAARFAAELTLPDIDGPEIWPLALTQAERLALIDITLPINRGAWEHDGHHLLGYPYNLDYPAEAACGPDSPIATGEWTHANEERRREIERIAADRWRLLLQVDSSESAGMNWAGGGLLHICIEREALRQRDFSRVWLNMQFL